MQRLPRIGIPAPTSGDLDYNRSCGPDYATAVAACGGDPVEIPLGLPPDAMARLARTCDSFVLPGSPADVDPRRYGQEPHTECAPADPQREATDLILLEHAYLHAKPLLCICFGAQILNVWRGGTLIQDLTYIPVNHAAGRSVAVAHSVVVSSGTILAGILQSDDKREVAPGSKGPPSQDGFLRLSINSSHHQAAAIPGDGLTVVARCPSDGVIEALEGDDPRHFVLAVQWHPERSFEGDLASRQIFSHLVQASLPVLAGAGSPA